MGSVEEVAPAVGGGESGPLKLTDFCIFVLCGVNIVETSLRMIPLVGVVVGVASGVP